MTNSPNGAKPRSGRLFLIGSAVVVVALFLAVGVKFLATAGESGGGGPPPVPVVVAPVEQREFTDLVEAIGTLRAKESVAITATVTETVRSVSFESGMAVEEGFILAELTSGQEAAELSDARARLEEAEHQHARSVDLVKKGAASKARLDETLSVRDQARAQVKAIEARLDDRLVRAPFSGVVGLRFVSPGALVQPGDEIATLDDISALKLDFAVPETVLAGVEPGMKVMATAAAFPGEEFGGEVESIDSRVDPVTRSILVRSMLPNESGRLRPGMLMTVELIKRVRSVPAVPELAVLAERDSTFVFVLVGGETPSVAMRPIEIGQRRAGYIEIVSGVDVGTMIVLEGVNRLRDGDAVQV